MDKDEAVKVILDVINNYDISYQTQNKLREIINLIILEKL